MGLGVTSTRIGTRIVRERTGDDTRRIGRIEGSDLRFTLRT